MESKFKPMHSYFTGESFNTYIDVDRNLVLHQPSYLLKEDKWQIKPNTNEGEYLNDFYSFYPNGVEGTKEQCLEIIKDYKTKKERNAN